MAAKFTTGTRVRWTEGYVAVTGTVEEVHMTLYGGQPNHSYSLRVTDAKYQTGTPAYAAKNDPTWRIGGLIIEQEFRLSV